jgi:hypothetical protein
MPLADTLLCLALAGVPPTPAVPLELPIASEQALRQRCALVLWVCQRPWQVPGCVSAVTDDWPALEGPGVILCVFERGELQPVAFIYGPATPWRVFLLLLDAHEKRQRARQHEISA